MGAQFGTQKGAEDAVEAVDAVHAVRIFLSNLVLLIPKTSLGVELDTVGVWGSNPHAPTIPFNDLEQLTAFSVVPEDTI
ncbi:MAG TPA: hypothetical protein VLE19_08635 [Pyrinomonadaceae bacterium]|nr:hypothetical protein [Pyrinomonadaceae bacterium]